MAVIAADPRGLDQPPLRGPRLRLRAFTGADAPGLVTLLGDWAVVEWAGEIAWPFGFDQAIDLICHARRHLAQGRDSIFAADSADGRLIGCVALHQVRGGGGRLGYWFGQAHWGQGYASEAIRLALAYGFAQRGFAWIEAEAHEENIASWRALARAGFRFTGTVPLTFEARGVTIAARRYVMTVEEWQ